MIYFFLILVFGVGQLIHNSVIGIKQLKENHVNKFQLKNKLCKFTEDNATLTCNYIPTSIPDGMSRVHIENFVTADTFLEVKPSDFESESWGHITQLIMSDNLNKNEPLLGFDARSLINLKSLKKIEMHILSNFQLHPDTFIGLNNVTTLDVAYCARLEWKKLLSALNTTNKMPSLETLIVSEIYYLVNSLSIGPEIGVLSSKQNLKVIEIANTNLAVLNLSNFSDLNFLEVINVSHSHFTDISPQFPPVKYMKKIHILDLGNAVVPSLNPIIPHEIVNKAFVLVKVPMMSFVFAPRIVNVSGVIPNNTRIWIKNCTAKCITDLDINLQQIFANHNNIMYGDLDLDVNCKKYAINSVIRVDLTYNGLQFIHPSILSFIPNIKYLNLSMNELSVMASDNLQLFENLFEGLPKLQEISLSGNRLNIIPCNMFTENTKLELIDLSHNQLSQVTFDLSRAKRLRTLLLHNNQITILDSASINDLMNIPQISVPQRNQTNFTVTFYGNPLSCAQCQAKQYLIWLLSKDLFGNQNIKCYSEQGNTREINDSVLNYVENICRRQLTLISNCVSGSTVLLVLVICLFKIYKRYLNDEKTKKYTKALKLLNQGQNQYEFATFLSYSSLDDYFVKHCVIRQLETCLNETTGIDRTLICEGDLNLRPGFHVLDETIRCIERASVVIVVVSNNFCQSIYCHNELYQAYHLKKPILLLFKERVDEQVMTPVMKLLFKQNVRVLFEYTNGEYKLKNTWENVCTSIIHLIADQI